MALNSTQSIRLIISKYRLIKIFPGPAGPVSWILWPNICAKTFPGNRAPPCGCRCRVLDQHGDRDLRLVVRREPDKPRTIQAPVLWSYCAVPVLPATASPFTWARLAVPPTS